MLEWIRANPVLAFGIGIILAWVFGKLLARWTLRGSKRKSESTIPDLPALLKDQNSYLVSEITERWSGYWIGLTSLQMERLHVKPERQVNVQFGNIMHFARVREVIVPEKEKWKGGGIRMSPTLADFLECNPGNSVILTAVPTET